MENQLNGLLSNNSKRAIIVNGKLVLRNNHLVVLRRNMYTPIFEEVVKGGDPRIIEEGQKILDPIVDAFNAKYSEIYTGEKTSEQLREFSAHIDSYTGAIVVQNELYSFMMDKDNINHFHDGTRQFNDSVRETINDFIVEFTKNYLELFIYLLNNRLMSAHTPMSIKGHLIAGLYQPLSVKTASIDCPLDFDEFAWFESFLNYPSPVVEHLNSTGAKNAGLDISAVSMYDFSRKFNTKCMKELNRLHFLFILYTILLSTINQDAPNEMGHKFNSIWSSIQAGRGNDADTMQFFSECLDGINRARTQIVARV